MALPHPFSSESPVRTCVLLEGLISQVEYVPKEVVRRRGLRAAEAYDS